MKGSIHYQKDRNRWRVVWYDIRARKNRHIYRYNGQYMPCTVFKMRGGQVLLDIKGRPSPDKDKCQGYEMARKLRALMQGRWEQFLRGEGSFRIEEFTKDGWTDTIEYYQKWITDVIEPGRKPATIKGYKSYARTWIEPFFTEHPVRLHEIELDTLTSFLKFIMTGLKKKTKSVDPKTDIILKVHNENPELKSPRLKKVIEKEHKLSISESWIRRVLARHKKSITTEKKKSSNVGKTAMNIMSSFHAMMDYAYRSKRIPAVPPFPKKEDYDLKGKDIDYLTPEDFEKVFDQIPDEHKPIFKFLQLHFRRPGEACALHKVDYDPINSYFKIHRAISDRKLVDSVKTNWKNPKIHRIDCDPSFAGIANRLLSKNSNSPFLFVNPRARKDGGRYTLESMRNVWYKACDDAGIRRIWQYKGLKHTACMEFIENGGTGDELMVMTDHAKRESVDQYMEITLRRKRLGREQARKRKDQAATENAARWQNVGNVVPFKKKS